MDSIDYWCKKYSELKNYALCLDLEGDGNKGISVVGLYIPKDGEIDSFAFIKNQNLDIENLRPFFSKAKMLITFNGFSFDIPQLKKDFPGLIPEDIPVFDIYILAKNLGLDTNLKVLETTLGIDRMDDFSKRRKIATRLWLKYQKYGDEVALARLIEYNKQDTINLYPLAEKLIEIAKNR